MFKLAIICALLVAVKGAAPRVQPIVPTLDGRIVGGQETTIEQIPYQLSLQYFGSHTCGASLISETRALTAGHCTDGRGPEYFTIRAGSSIRGSGGQVTQVAKISQHPNYNAWIIDYDVSVLTLANKLDLGVSIQPINLHAIGQELVAGTLCTVSGWGTLSSGGFLPKTLRRVDVPKVDDEVCKKAYGEGAITDRMTCHGFQNGGKDSCQGDSGGPLVSDGVQVGVVSWGYGCAAPNFPGVYTKIANRDIHFHIRQNL